MSDSFDNTHELDFLNDTSKLGDVSPNAPSLEEDLREEGIVGDTTAIDPIQEPADEEQPPQQSENMYHLKTKDAVESTDKNSKKKGKKNGKTPKDGKKKTWKSVLKVCLTIFLVCVILGSVVCAGFIAYVYSTMKNDDELLNFDNVKLAYSTFVYAGEYGSDNVTEIASISDESNRIWVDYENIPENMINAVIAIEDDRFWTHHGVDWKRTIGATINEIIPIWSSRQGGSTITQQVIKNITNDKSATGIQGYTRKAREILRALKLEKMYSKEEIMEVYLNVFHLGNNTDGVQAAALLYFGKDVKDLTLAECASIAAITQSPSYYEPLGHPENNRERQLKVLDEMLDQEMISKEEYDEAVAQEMVFTNTGEDGTTVETTTSNEVYSWYVEAALDQVEEDLKNEYGYDEDQIHDIIFNSGLRIYTPCDLDIQSAMEKIYANPDYFMKTSAEVQPESAAAVMDFNGNVLGMVGGRGTKDGNQLLNRAYSVPRQIGSCMKPISPYSLGIEKNLITWSTIFEDSPVMKNNGKDWPVNYYGSYRGDMTVQYALAHSVNTVAVKVEQLVTPQASYNHLTSNLGVSTLVDADINLSPMALGALTNGMTPLELCAAYCIFGSGGVYYEPRLYTVVTDQFGNILLDRRTAESKQAISADTVTVMNKLMQTVMTSGTATSYRFGSMPLAGKTGTTQDANDIWFAGMNPYYCCAVWWGYDQNGTLSETGYQPAATWKRIMSTISSGLANKDFATSSGVVSKTYCTKTGLLASDDCAETATGWYKKSNIPDTCTQCTEEKQKEEEAQKPQEKPDEGDGNEGETDGGTTEGGGEESGSDSGSIWDIINGWQNAG